MDSAAGRIFKYVTLPEVLPRMRELLGTGFGFIAFCMACIFENARLIPANHPYVRPANIGKFGIHHVLGQAALNLKFKYKNADQIALFFLMILGAVLLMVQIALMGFAFFSQAAFATPLPSTFAGFFESPDPTNDISFMLMDRIFGIPGLFDSCVAQNIPCLPLENPSAMAAGAFPMPYHIALQDMLGFYSQGLLILAAIIIGYYVFTLLAEMSETGTVFGKRFNRAWAPLRIVVALGLLIPMTNNLNAAQYITLYITKYGSAFATNGWNFFITSMALTDDNTLAGDRAQMIAKPQYPMANEIIQFMSTAHTCKSAYRKIYGTYIDAYAIRAPRTDGQPDHEVFVNLQGSAMTYYDLQEWYEMGDIVIVMGEYDAVKHRAYKGNVRPYCGVVIMPSTRFAKPTTGNYYDGADSVAYAYINYLMPWDGGSVSANGISLDDIAEAVTGHTLPTHKNTTIPIPSKEDQRALLDYFNDAIRGYVDTGLQRMQENTEWTNKALAYGWGGAAIWYNTIAQANGEFTEAVFTLPTVNKYPEIMEWVKEEKGKNDSVISGETAFEPHLANGQSVMEGRNEKDKAILNSLYKSYTLWNDFTKEIQPESTGNVFTDSVHAIFEKVGLWSLRENEAIHPLSSMTSMGKALLVKSIYAFGGGAVTGISGATHIFGKGTIPEMIANNLSAFMITVAYIGLGAGILLYYVVPFLPFIYFMFAIMGWAKTIFEAMVGIPLWALAHLRYDGEGFPTQQSMYGYYLLLDIFLRPILIIFGLIASVTIFYALARTLNNVFDTVTSNLTGFDTPAATAPGGPAANQVGNLTHLRGAIDQLFFTVIYSIMVYMIGLSCFKMIDLFPNSILRWIGSTATGHDSRQEEDSGQMMSGNMQAGTFRVSDATKSMTGGITGRDYGGDEG